MNITFRDPSEVDRDQLSRWITQDCCPQHNDVAPEFWMPEAKEGTKCMAVEEDGKVLFYLKLENVMRCYIQFPPDAERDKFATSLALKKAFFTVAAGAKNLGYREIIFESKSDGLVNLFTKLHFTEAQNNFLVRL